MCPLCLTIATIATAALRPWRLTRGRRADAGSWRR